MNMHTIPTSQTFMGRAKEMDFQPQCAKQKKENYPHRKNFTYRGDARGQFEKSGEKSTAIVSSS